MSFEMFASSGDLYGTKMPASSPLLSRVLSMPKKTSPRGLLLVRIAWLTAVPASPDGSTFTVTPVFFVNSRITFFEAANESCDISVIVVLPELRGADADAETGPATIAAAASSERVRASAWNRRLVRLLLGRVARPALRHARS